MHKKRLYIVVVMTLIVFLFSHSVFGQYNEIMEYAPDNIYPVDQVPFDFVDYDQDGLVDILYYEDTNRYVTVVYFLKNMGGDFAEPVQVMELDSPTIWDYDSFYKVYDLDQDSLTDFITIYSGESFYKSFQWRRNTGEGFEEPVDIYSYHLDSLNSELFIEQFLDFDQDGDTDILMGGGQFETEVYDYFWLENVDNVFYEQDTLLVRDGGFSDIIMADFDGDGVDEWIFDTSENNMLSLYRTARSGAEFSEPECIKPLIASWCIGDAEGDGDMDVFIRFLERDAADVITYYFSIMINDGTGNFTEILKETERISSQNIYDMDGDGDVDIHRILNKATYDTVTFQATVASQIDYYENIGNYTFALVDSTKITDDYFIERYFVYDFDGDQISDLVCILKCNNEFLSKLVWFPSTVITSVERPGPIAPQSFQLYANYPNPFNPETNIQFDIPEADRVTLEIFDVQGRLVNTLVNGWYGPGSHSVTWNGATTAGGQAASGMYFYRIRYRDQVNMQKMLLIR